jgi:hypothetical protein
MDLLPMTVPLGQNRTFILECGGVRRQSSSVDMWFVFSSAYAQRLTGPVKHVS